MDLATSEDAWSMPPFSMKHLFVVVMGLSVGSVAVGLFSLVFRKLFRIGGRSIASDATRMALQTLSGSKDNYCPLKSQQDQVDARRKLFAELEADKKAAQKERDRLKERCAVLERENAAAKEDSLLDDALHQIGELEDELKQTTADAKTDRVHLINAMRIVYNRFFVKESNPLGARRCELDTDDLNDLRDAADAVTKKRNLADAVVYMTDAESSEDEAADVKTSDDDNDVSAQRAATERVVYRSEIQGIGDKVESQYIGGEAPPSLSAS